MNEKKHFIYEYNNNPRIKELPKIESYLLDDNIINALNEVIICYALGANRATIIISFSIIEYLFRQIFYKEDTETKISKLFERAFNQQLLSLEEYNFLKGFNIARNVSVHNISKQVNETDTKLMLLILIKILNKDKKINLLS